ncbi:MAG TPA: GDP-mannose 4,6-dehydratase [Jatrophihabitans sp.]|uniref:GDP-mannose 4,6-dehydratase n=1 Tax=Jatrophihabitans sp. TaxID=1932789 RepID=UPI002F1E909A
MRPAGAPTAFVTGITGQDGGYLTERLLAEGVSVHGLVHGHDEQASALTRRCPAAVLHEGDLTDGDRIRALIAELEPDEVYNLGGISSVAFSWEQPVLTGQVSGLGAVAVLDACWQLQQRTGRPVRVLQASSAEIFGNPEQAPQNELTPLRPGTPYGAAKAYAHQMAAIFRSRGLAASAVILYNHESPRRPETFVTRKITAAAARIAAGRQDSLSLGSLDVRRDWGWAPDYVEAMVRAVRHSQADDYVIATGESHTVADFVAAAFDAAGVADWQSRVRVDPSFVRPADATEQRGDATKARTVLGWAPTRDFAAVVAAMVEADLSLL